MLPTTIGVFNQGTLNHFKTHIMTTTLLIALFFAVVVGLGTVKYTKQAFGKVNWEMVAVWAACAFMLLILIGWVTA